MRRRAFVSLLGGAALAPFTGSPVRADPPGGCGVPVAHDDGWTVAPANESGLIDRDALCRMADRLASTANVHAVLVARGGRLVFERYFKGDDEVPGRIYGRRVENVTFDADTLHDMKSASKSVASLAFGIAIDRGLIRSVNEPIFSFFPELSDLRTPERDRFRLVHALTMSMGLQWVEATPSTGDYDNDEARMHMASDQCRYVLSLPATAPPGQEFFYNTGTLALLSAIMRKATGRPLDEFRAREFVRADGHHQHGVDAIQGGFRCRRRIAHAATRHGQDRPACPRGRSLERPPARFEVMDRDLDITQDQGQRRSILWIFVVARSRPAQWP